MKILSIGNSFSQDPHAHLHELAAQNGVEIYACNLYISACSLRTHAAHLTDGADAYELEINGQSTGDRISIAAALAMEAWDVITLQQVSHLSGLPSSYVPWFGQLYNAVRAACPGAQIWFQHTWAYATNSNHPLYKLYNRDQQTMLRRAQACKDMVVRMWGIPVISTGDVIQKLRPVLGEERLHRDTFHLSYDYGRLAAAAVWFKTLTGKAIAKQSYRDLDQTLTDAIYDEVNKL